MHAHIVLAHPEPKSYNAHLTHVARNSLEKIGWTTTLSDLYAKNFDPCERASHFASPQDDSRFDVQGEHMHASTNNVIPGDVTDEIELLDQADLVIFQYPMWWHLPPAMLKGWFDRVFIYGEVYASKKRFENGRYTGRRAMVSVTVGTGENTYAFNGRSGDINLMLWPVHFTMAYVGYTVLEPFVAYGVEAGLKYSSQDTIDKRLLDVDQSFETVLHSLDQRTTLSFNKMAEWGEDGLIRPDAPVYSPFVRHKEHLDLK